MLSPYLKLGLAKCYHATSQVQSQPVSSICNWSPYMCCWLVTQLMTGTDLDLIGENIYDVKNIFMDSCTCNSPPYTLRQLTMRHDFNWPPYTLQLTAYCNVYMPSLMPHCLCMLNVTIFNASVLCVSKVIIDWSSVHFSYILSYLKTKNNWIIISVKMFQIIQHLS